MVRVSVPRRPAGRCSSAGPGGSGRTAGTASSRWAAPHTGGGSPELMEDRGHVNPCARHTARMDVCHARTRTYPQVRAASHVREAQHVSPFEAAAFAPPACRNRTHRVTRSPRSQTIVRGAIYRRRNRYCDRIAARTCTTQLHKVCVSTQQTT